ncbi:endonuclease-3 [Thermosporothrix hazakensis]|uniref:Endonuclease-3 n=2 Tax=Thermosporothrix TaxID=768650 RepID=A0A326TZR2_THEHA|nr:endonuclease III [Thermosporothrix hazakensis]PZW22388.1 endonuclease-3 [Thermosporothrix hazakensis]BBH91090.1 endonuclease III [Thermosporothrix sp. COM3]GCE49142.1 endonuclease III [Thermosporothrix hazakensis]
MKRKIQRNPADYGYPTDDIAALSQKALEVTHRLTEFYGVAPWPTKDPMSMLVDIILSHRTRDEQTAAAYDNLLKQFGSWEAVRDAPTEQVEAVISNVNWPEQKAPRLQAIMRRITEEKGSLNLDFLRDMPLEAASNWLGQLEGVGPKTNACVLLFSCRKPTLPVDVHVHRVSIRLGLIGKKVSAEAAHTLLQALLPQDAQVIYNFHKGLLRHGQRICVYERPRCKKCVLTDLCNYYQQVVLPTNVSPS